MLVRWFSLVEVQWKHPWIALHASDAVEVCEPRSEFEKSFFRVPSS
jgi:hypothetical protein